MKLSSGSNIDNIDNRSNMFWGVCIPFNPQGDPVYDVSDNLYDVRYNVYDVCGKTCDETDNVYDVRDKTSEKGVPTCGEGDFVEIYCFPGGGAPIPVLKSTVTPR